MLLGGQSRPPEPSAVQRIMAGGGRAVGVADGHWGFIAKSSNREGRAPSPERLSHWRRSPVGYGCWARFR